MSLRVQIFTLHSETPEAVASNAFWVLELSSMSPEAPILLFFWKMLLLPAASCTLEKLCEYVGQGWSV
jgi:hypothetical protein